VLVIGAAGLDAVGRVRGDLKSGTSNPARIRLSFGGAARNVAENLARLGQPVSLISAVGYDEVGDQILAAARQAGVDVSGVVRAKEQPTGSYLAVLDAQGRLKFGLDDMRAMSVITPDVLKARAEMFYDASLVFVDTNLPRDTLRTAVSLARKAQIPVCADATSLSLAGRLKPHLPRLHLITPNTAEAGVLCGRTIGEDDRDDALDAAKCLVSAGVKIVIITMGELGLVYATSETSGQIPAIRTEVLDPTGVGDALTATVIFALLNDIPLDDAVRLGVAAASLTLRHLGSVVQDLSLQKLYDGLVI